LEELALEMLPLEWELPCPEQPPHDTRWRKAMDEKRKAWEEKH